MRVHAFPCQRSIQAVCGLGTHSDTVMPVALCCSRKEFASAPSAQIRSVSVVKRSTVIDHSFIDNHRIVQASLDRVMSPTFPACDRL